MRYVFTATGRKLPSFTGMPCALTMNRTALGLSSLVIWQLGWALMEIATHPEVQAKLHAELKKYHLLHGAEEQKRDVMPSDLPSLKYLRAVRRLPIHLATPLTSLNSKTTIRMVGRCFASPCAYTPQQVSAPYGG